MRVPESRARRDSLARGLYYVQLRSGLCGTRARTVDAGTLTTVLYSLLVRLLGIIGIYTVLASQGV